MDKLDGYRQIVREILTEHGKGFEQITSMSFPEDIDFI
jgi:hypothetical protein